MNLTESTKELSLEDIILQFDGLYEKQEIENKMSEMWLDLGDEEKDKFISDIQEINSSEGGITKSMKREGILKRDGIEYINDVFIQLQESSKNKVIGLSENTNLIKKIESTLSSDIDVLDGHYINIINKLEREIKKLKKYGINVDFFEKRFLEFKIENDIKGFYKNIEIIEGILKENNDFDEPEFSEYELKLNNSLSYIINYIFTNESFDFDNKQKKSYNECISLYENLHGKVYKYLIEKNIKYFTENKDDDIMESNLNLYINNIKNPLLANIINIPIDDDAIKKLEDEIEHLKK